MSKHERNIHFGRAWARKMGKTEAIRRAAQGLDVVAVPALSVGVPSVRPEIDGIPPRPVKDKELEAMLDTLDFHPLGLHTGAKPVG